MVVMLQRSNACNIFQDTGFQKVRNGRNDLATVQVAGTETAGVEV